MAERIRIRQRDGTIIGGIPNYIKTFIDSFKNCFYQIKEIINDQDQKKQLIIAAIFEYIFFYRPSEFSNLWNCMNFSQVNAQYFADLIERQKLEGMQLLDEQFNTKEFKEHSIWLTNTICGFNSQNEDDFDHKLFKKLTRSLNFTAILIKRDAKIVYSSPLSQIFMIIFLDNSRYFVFYPKLSFDWSQVMNYSPQNIHCNQEGTIRLGCFCLVNLPTYESGVKLWEELSNYISKCSACKIKYTPIDCQIIKEKREQFFNDKCLYCKKNQNLIIFQTIGYSFCQNCIWTCKNEITENFYIMPKKKKCSEKHFLAEVESERKKIEENYFKCEVCQTPNIDKNDYEQSCFDLSHNRKICRKCIKKLICPDTIPSKDSTYKTCKDLGLDKNDIFLIRRDTEFLLLFCVRCMEELPYKENKPIPDHELCSAKYCQECFNKLDIDICDFCNCILINIHNKTPWDNCIYCRGSFPKKSIIDGLCVFCIKNAPYDYCNDCKGCFPKSILIDGQCDSCKKSDMDIDPETQPHQPGINPDPKLIHNSIGSREIANNLQNELNIAENELRIHIDCKKFNGSEIELVPEFPSNYEIYAGKHLKFVINFDKNLDPIAIKASPIDKNSNIFHPNFSKEGLLSEKFINEKLKRMRIYCILKKLFTIIEKPNKKCVVNECAWKSWNRSEDHSIYKSMAKRYLQTSGLD